MARTPSKAAHEKVLEAALGLIAERGIEGTSMDAIASASGVSKATVYKHWENKDALLIELITRSMDRPPEFNSGDPREDLTSLIRFLVQSRKHAELGKIWPRVIGYAVSNPEFGRALQEHSFGPRRVQIARLLKEAAEKGELRGDIDCDLALDLLIGPIMHRRFVNDRNIPADLPEKIVDYFWKVFGIR